MSTQVIDDVFTRGSYPATPPGVPTTGSGGWVDNYAISWTVPSAGQLSIASGHAGSVTVNTPLTRPAGEAAMQSSITAVTLPLIAADGTSQHYFIVYPKYDVTTGNGYGFWLNCSSTAAQLVAFRYVGATRTLIGSSVGVGASITGHRYQIKATADCNAGVTTLLANVYDLDGGSPTVSLGTISTTDSTSGLQIAMPPGVSFFNNITTLVGFAEVTTFNDSVAIALADPYIFSGTPTVVTAKVANASGGTGGPYTYQWNMRVNGGLGAFSPISGATSQTLAYTLPNPLLAYDLNCTVTDGTNTVTTTNWVTAVAWNPPKILGLVGDSRLANGSAADSTGSWIARFLSKASGPRLITLVNGAQAGSTTGLWLPTAAGGAGNLFNTLVTNLNAAVTAASLTAADVIVGIGLGINDVTSTASHIANMQAIIDGLIAASFVNIAVYDEYWAKGNQGTTIKTFTDLYAAQLAGRGAPGANVKYVNCNLWNYFTQHGTAGAWATDYSQTAGSLSDLDDGLHPTGVDTTHVGPGRQFLGAIRGPATALAFGLAPSNGTSTGGGTIFQPSIFVGDRR